MHRVLAVVALAAACSKHADAPSSTRLPIVPDRVTAHLGDVGFVLAVDLNHLDLGAIAALIPDQLGCTRELLAAADSAVITASDSWEGFVTGLPETATWTCIGKLAPLFGATARAGSGDGYFLDIPGASISLTWHDRTVAIAEAGHALRSGDPPGVIFDLAAQVPRTAKGWIVSSGFPAYKIKSSVAWLETSPTAWVFTVTAEGSEQGAAKPWLESIVAGFKAGAGAKGVAVDDRWFAIDATPARGKLVATVPIEAFTTAAK